MTLPGPSATDGICTAPLGADFFAEEGLAAWAPGQYRKRSNLLTGKPMHIDPAEHTPAEGYKLLSNLVVPRPIAWVSTRNAQGTVNLAPFSFFNALGSHPLYIGVSVARKDDGALKDTARNIEAHGEFVVNFVSEALFPAMNLSAADFPPDVSELEIAGLHTAPSLRIATPRVAESPAALECRLHQRVELGAYTLYIGEVEMMHVADNLLGPRLHVHGFSPVGRMGAPSVYCRTTDRFDVPRVTYAELQPPRQGKGPTQS